MAYLALYRQHRPRTLAEVVDQGHVVRTLGNAISSNKLVHAYLFTGPRGTGKTSVARVLARSLNCVEGPTVQPCGVCPSCLAIDNGSALDVREIDAASNRSIDDVRDLRQSMHYVADARYKIYIIDEVHMLSPEAFNALLKTLEEPPEHVIFVLATTEIHKIPLTILSRCQRFDFRRIGKTAMIEHLRGIMEQTGTRISEEALDLLAERAQGGLRDALSMLDQCLIYADGEIGLSDLLAVLGSVDQDTLLTLLKLALASDAPAMLQYLDGIEDSGRDLMQLLYDLMQLLRMIVAKPAAFTDRLQMSSQQAVQALDLLSRCEIEMKQSANPRLALELALFRIAEEAIYGGRIQALEARLQALEQGQTLAPAAPMTAAAASTGRPKVPAAAPEPAASAGKERAGQRTAPISPPTAATGPPEASAAGRAETESRPVVTAPPLSGSERQNAAAKRPPVADDDRKSPATPAADSGDSSSASTAANGLQAIKANWEQILERTQKERVSLHAILQHGRVLDYRDGQLEIVFVQEFHRKIADKPENRMLVEQLVEKICGLQCHLSLLLTKDIVGRSGPKPEMAAAPPTSVPPAAEPSEDLLVTAAFALVGKENVRIIEM